MKKSNSVNGILLTDENDNIIYADQQRVGVDTEYSYVLPIIENIFGIYTSSSEGGIEEIAND